MANIDLRPLAYDPDFAESVTLIRRLLTVNQYGEAELTETQSVITAVISAAAPKDVEKVLNMAGINGAINVCFSGKLHTQSPSGYSDVILWDGGRYEVKAIVNRYTTTTGDGYTEVMCLLSDANNG